MEIDDMKQLWTSHNASLERSLAINERLLRETLLGKVRSAFILFHIGRILEVVMGIATVAASVSVLANHLVNPLVVIVAGGVAMLMAWLSWLCADCLVKSWSVDYAAPVITLQRSIEQLRLADYRAFKWALLLGIVAWLPVSLILFEAFTGFNALAFVGVAWLSANVIFGLICLGIGHLLSKQYLEGDHLSPWAGRLRDALTNRAVRKAAERLAELATFESSM